MRFTLRQLLAAVAWFSAAFAVVGAVVQFGQPLNGPSVPWLALASPLLVFPLVGAGVGTLLQDAGWGLYRGFVCAFILYFLGPVIAIAGLIKLW